jgi:hypothetical protein
VPVAELEGNRHSDHMLIGEPTDVWLAREHTRTADFISSLSELTTVDVSFQMITVLKIQNIMFSFLYFSPSSYYVYMVYMVSLKV